MKTLNERMQSIREKGEVGRKKQRVRRIIASSVSGILVMSLLLVLFVPYSTALPDVSRYADSPYYHVIEGINKATYQPPRFKNNFEYLLSNGVRYAVGDDMMNSAVAEGTVNTGIGSLPPMAMPEEVPPTGNKNENAYQEVTDNQVEGVIEADLFKRTDGHIFYWYGTNLYVYSIEKDNSSRVGEYNLRAQEETHDLHYPYGTEMYLSQDGKSLTLLLETATKEMNNATVLIRLDVSDPKNIVQTDILFFEGNYISSRMVAGDILLTYNYRVRNADFDDPATFVPTYGSLENQEAIPAEKIYCSDIVESARYTVFARISADNLEVEDTVALMGYSQQLYVSEDAIYATHSYSRKIEKGLSTYTTISMTDITGISYAGEGLSVLGTIQLEGSVKDQYSMDQYDGILRVATSTLRRKYKESIDGNYAFVTTDGAERNCNLYCIDLSSWEVAASVEQFAPAGEEVTSARFDGTKAYICTAEVVVLSDPVYYFDLSDLSNITWTDSGIIDGYSSSLINFGDYLLGIGFGAERGLKVEAYVETQQGVESIGVYELFADFSNDYKSYFIDRENNLVGIPVWEWNSSVGRYVLLQFDGYEFKELCKIATAKYVGEHTRATMVDGWLYLLYGESFTTRQIH